MMYNLPEKPRTKTPPLFRVNMNEKGKPIIYAQPHANFQKIPHEDKSKNISPYIQGKSKRTKNYPNQEAQNFDYYNIRPKRESLQKNEAYYNHEFKHHYHEIRRNDVKLNNMKGYNYNYTEDKPITKQGNFQDQQFKSPLFQQPQIPNIPLVQQIPGYPNNFPQNFQVNQNIPPNPKKDFLTIDQTPTKHGYTQKHLKDTIIIPRKIYIGLNSGDIKQDYSFLKKLGQGSFGVVYKAMHKKTKDYRAIKIMEKTMINNNPSLAVQIKSEYNILRELDHPNIIKIYEAYENSNQIFIVTELLSGGTLLDKMGKKNLIDELQILKWVTKIVMALNYCHGKKFAHRDLKPENIMFDKDDNLKLIDFGLSGFIDAKKKYLLFRFHEVVGSPIYMAPEVNIIRL